jgi:hypothetical protein
MFNAWIYAIITGAWIIAFLGSTGPVRFPPRIRIRFRRRRPIVFTPSSRRRRPMKTTTSVSLCVPNRGGRNAGLRWTMRRRVVVQVVVRERK